MAQEGSRLYIATFGSVDAVVRRSQQACRTFEYAAAVAGSGADEAFWRDRAERFGAIPDPFELLRADWPPWQLAGGAGRRIEEPFTIEAVRCGYARGAVSEPEALIAWLEALRGEGYFEHAAAPFGAFAEPADPDPEAAAKPEVVRPVFDLTKAGAPRGHRVDGQKLKTLRGGMSQDALHEAAGVSMDTLQRGERWSDNTFHLVAMALSKTADQPITADDLKAANSRK